MNKYRKITYSILIRDYKKMLIELLWKGTDRQDSSIVCIESNIKRLEQEIK